MRKIPENLYYACLYADTHTNEAISKIAKKYGVNRRTLTDRLHNYKLYSVNYQGYI